jgi:hypothetical protein
MPGIITSSTTPVELLLSQQFQGAGAVRGDACRKAPQAQPFGQAFHEFGFIIDQQNVKCFHGLSPRLYAGVEGHAEHH